MGGMMAGGGMGQMMASRMGQMGQNPYGQMMRGMGGAMGMPGGPGMDRMRGGMAGMGMMGGMMGGVGGASEGPSNYWKSDERKVMVRALDFTVEEDTTYRYRARIVVFNPNRNHEDVSPGVDTKSEELRGPWSEVSDQVSMPPDIMPYAVGTLPKSARGDTKVNFQVIRFHPADGVTVPSTFDASPGEVIGDLRTREIPSSEGKGKKAKAIDFNTRQIVLDVEGGQLQPLPAGLIGPALKRPALALLLRADGSVMIHNEADDISNEIRRDIETNYRHELDQSHKKRESSMGMGMMGMMGGNMMRSMMGGRGR
jgi:hypothetical protein